MARRFAALLALLLGPAVCAQELPNLLLITIDTLRADHLSSYGYHLRTSPNIDRLAAEGVRFANAHTVIPLTGPAHISLFTSRYPQEHGARINGLSQRSDARVLMLPQVLRRYGYRNAAFVSAWPLNSRLTHLNRWFDVYDEEMNRSYELVNSQRWAEDVAPRALAWLGSNRARPFLLWVHFFDPHAPYDLRAGFEDLPAAGDPPGGPVLSAAAAQRIRAYDSEIAYADHYVGRILRAVDDLGLRESTLVVLLADHGESLGEHDYVGHGRNLYESIVHVPLIFRWPGVVRAGKVVEQDVSLLDVAPTVIDLTVRRREPGWTSPVPMAGRSLSAALDGGGEPAQETIRYVTFGGRKGFLPRFMTTWFVNSGSLPLKVGQRNRDRKVVWSPREKGLEVFDLSRDPGELFPAEPARESPVYEAESRRLRLWLDKTGGKSGENRMTGRDLEVLRSLGYIQ
jgi:arylsulfatase A-like enzyme